MKEIWSFSDIGYHVPQWLIGSLYVNNIFAACGSIVIVLIKPSIWAMRTGDFDACCICAKASNKRPY